MDHQALRTPISGKPKTRKRMQNNKMSDDQKRDLIFRVLHLNENVKFVCRDLGFSFSTGRNILLKYKKTGHYDTQPKPWCSTPSTAPERQQSTDKGFVSRHAPIPEVGIKVCPFGLVMLESSQISLVLGRIYTPEEEATLTKLNSWLLHTHLI